MSKTPWSFRRRLDDGGYTAMPWVAFSQARANLSANAGFATPDVLRAVPFFVPAEGLSFTRFGLHARAGMVGAYRMGVYSTLPPGPGAVSVYPQALLADFGVATVVADSPFFVLSSITLPNGLYWLAASALAGTAGQMTVSPYIYPTLLGAGVGSTQGGAVSIASPGSSLVLPATFPDLAVVQGTELAMWADDT